MKSKIQILWISLQTPYKNSPDAGGQTFYRYYSYLKENINCDIQVISVAPEKKALPEIKELDENQNIHLIIPEYQLNNVRNWGRRLEYYLNPWQKNGGLLSTYLYHQFIYELTMMKERSYYPDIVIFEWTGALAVADEVIKLWPKTKLIASEVDVTFVGYLRKFQNARGLNKLFWNIRYKVEKKFELENLSKCNLILPQNPDNRMLLINNGVKKERVQWLSPYFNDMTSNVRAPKNHDIIFYGAMGRMENELTAIWFIENVMPELSDTDVRFVIAGSHPSDRLKSYANERIIVTGFIESIANYFEKSLCFVAPLVLGAGIKVKVLESLSSGIPVLTNDIGIEGIPAQNKIHYLYCKEPKDYIGAIHKILENQSEAEEMGERAKKFIKDNYSFENACRHYSHEIIELTN